MMVRINLFWRSNTDPPVLFCLNSQNFYLKFSIYLLPKGWSNFLNFILLAQQPGEWGFQSHPLSLEEIR